MEQPDKKKIEYQRTLMRSRSVPDIHLVTFVLFPWWSS